MLHFEQMLSSIALLLPFGSLDVSEDCSEGKYLH